MVILCVVEAMSLPSNLQPLIQEVMLSMELCAVVGLRVARLDFKV